jgi:hypothetical protein
MANFDPYFPKILQFEGTVYEYDPTVAFEQQAILDIQRFARSDLWTAQRDSRMRSQLDQIASRHRNTRQPQIRLRRYASQRDMLDMELDELIFGSKPKYEKVNWKKEGF